MNLRTALPLIGLLGTLVSGCSGSSDKPQTLPSITATPVASSSPAPIPVEATAKTSLSLEAFVRFYFKQLNVAFSTSDPAIIRNLSDPMCRTCENYAASFKPTERVRGDSFLLTDVAVPPVGNPVTNVEVFGAVPARSVVKPDGSLVRALPAAGKFHLVVAVARIGSEWRVASIGKATS